MDLTITMENMEPDHGELLHGGLMNSPKRFGDVVHRVQTDSTATLHRLLKHVRASGIAWVPEPKGIVDGHEVLSFIYGFVPHDMPKWIWEHSVLRQVATLLREWHDATLGFELEDAIWSMDTKTNHEVICHNDFAPYNCIFRQNEMVGLIDFDLCAPGSRLWDMAYTAYRFIPVLPQEPVHEHADISPYSKSEINSRIEIFLDAYAKDGNEFRYDRNELLKVMVERLKAISEWTRNYAQNTSNAALANNAVMYEKHSQWIRDELQNTNHENS